ncbi:OsmC family protein [Specibacter cremeus]|uniref:OsmC family protein n=1 Tax=Specibacter cremeus TaxID=1629051 RepID=UPI000F794230|nr:OsmC family protein [Specibacter cremeus]
MDQDFSVTASAGTFRPPGPGTLDFPHQWTAGGVSVQADFTGAHLLHLAVAGCVLNDLYREAATLGIDLDGVRVAAGGRFDPDTWQSTGIEYTVELASKAPVAELHHLLRMVDAEAEIPRALRAGATVRRAG